jgi:hypothetical protein
MTFFYKNIILLFFLGFTVQNALGQQLKESVVQFSGLIVTTDDNNLIPLPFTNILVKNSGRVTFSNLDGFFSVVGEMGDTVIFSAIGFKTVEYVIPDTLTENRYTVYQIMTRDTINLPETVVYPWPSREHFKIEFLALDIPEDLQNRAEENLTAVALDKLKESVPYDGTETGGYYLRKQAESYYSFGQAKPMHVLNPIAWSKFFKAWKNGEFKNKKKNN